MGRRRNPSVDLGLAVLETVRLPGETMKLQDIAEICGVSANRIAAIEKKALRKLREAVEREERTGRFSKR